MGLGGGSLACSWYQTGGSPSLSRQSVTARRGCKPRRKILTAFHLFTTVDWMRVLRVVGRLFLGHRAKLEFHYEADCPLVPKVTSKRGYNLGTAIPS